MADRTDGVRARGTRLSVTLVDRLAAVLITLGGFTAVVALIAICVSLVVVVVPLFQSSSADVRTDGNLGGDVLHVGIGAEGRLGWTLDRNGLARVVLLGSGRPLATESLLADGATVTAIATVPDAPVVAAGLADGRLVLGEIRLETRTVPPVQLQASERDLAIGASVPRKDGLLVRTTESAYREVNLTARLAPLSTLLKPLPIRPTTAGIVQLDMTTTPRGLRIARLDANGAMHLIDATRSDVWDRGHVATSVEAVPRAFGAVVPSFVRLGARGEQLFVGLGDGRLTRFEVRDDGAATIAERLDLTDPDVELTALEFLPSGRTLLAGDSTGIIRTWSIDAPREKTSTLDRRLLVAGPEFRGAPVAVSCLAADPQSRLFLAGFENGTVRIQHALSETLVFDQRVTERPITRGAIDRRARTAVVLVGSALLTFDVDADHTEVTARTLFRPVEAAGPHAPVHRWEAPSPSNPEGNFGLWALIFGTLKATFYAMLFGAPIALLGALYTTEFIGQSGRAFVKPLIEVMAGIPAVVLGVLALLIVAPFVDHAVVTVLVAVIAIPTSLMLGAHLWQLLPASLELRLRNIRFAFVCGVMLAGVGLAIAAGPSIERILFSGDFRGWLRQERGGATGGWILLLLPLCGVAVTIVVATRLNPWLRRVGLGRTARQCAWNELIKLIGAVALTCGAAFLLGSFLDSIGLDPRGAADAPYVERNALVAGFVMGFAVIPVIYSLAGEAMAAIPEYLRAASFASGATPWQTATRIVVPAARRGITAAVLMGVSRALAETMIVLIAVGPRPVLDWNVFNGFRTLSAGIAADLSSAAPGSTHYRTLLLGAGVLLALTLVFNAIAQLLKLRFRRRFHEH